MTSGTVITLRIGQSAGKVSKSVEGNFVWLGYGTPSTTEIKYLIEPLNGKRVWA